MSGKVIRTLRGSQLGSVLSNAELYLLANCGRICKFSPNRYLFAPGEIDERLFILRSGRVGLHLRVFSDGGQCEGEAEMEIDKPGDPFGWSYWMRPDRLQVTARALDPTSLIALDLRHLHDTQTFIRVSQRMLQILYGWLQEVGLCPPNIQAYLKFKQLMRV